MDSWPAGLHAIELKAFWTKVESKEPLHSCAPPSWPPHSCLQRYFCIIYSYTRIKRNVNIALDACLGWIALQLFQTGLAPSAFIAQSLGLNLSPSLWASVFSPWCPLWRCPGGVGLTGGACASAQQSGLCRQGSDVPHGWQHTDNAGWCGIHPALSHLIKLIIN